MQGFFVGNNITFNKSSFPSYLEEHKTIKSASIISIWKHKHHLSYYENDGGFIANVGTFIYKDNFNTDALKLFLNDTTIDFSYNTLKEKLRETRGQFILLIHYHDITIVATDRFRSLPVYKYEKGNSWAISNIYSVLTSFDKSIDKLGLSQKCSFGWIYPVLTDRTIYNEIKMLSPGTIYNLNNGDEKEYWSFKEIDYGKYQDFETLTDDLEKEVNKIYKFFDNVEGISCDITGGMDCRLSIEKLGDRRDVIFLNDVNLFDKHLKVGGRKYSEINIMKKIAKTLDIPYANLMGEEREFEKWLNENEEMIYKMIPPTLAKKRFYHYYQMSQLSSRVIGVAGWGGTEFMTGAPYHLDDCNYYFDLDYYLDVWQPFVDIVDGISERDYFLEIKDYVYTKLREVGWEEDSVDDYYNYFIYLTTYMNSQCEYWGVINTLMPIYTPYFDLIPIMSEVPMHMKGKYKIQRFLYEKIMRKDLRDIPTTHGHPAGKVTTKNFWKFLRLSNHNLQYHGIYSKIKKNVVDKLVYYSPYLKGLLRFMSKFSNRDFSFLNRELVSKHINEEQFQKVLINKQLIDWIKHLDQQLKRYE